MHAHKLLPIIIILMGLSNGCDSSHFSVSMKKVGLPNNSAGRGPSPCPGSSPDPVGSPVTNSTELYQNVDAE